MVRIIFAIFEYNHKNMDLEFLSIEFLNNSVKDYLYFFLVIIIGLISQERSLLPFQIGQKFNFYPSITMIYLD